MQPRAASSSRRRERRLVVLLLLIFWIGFQTIWFSFLTLRGTAPLPAPLDWIKALLAYYVRPEEVVICGLGAVVCYLIYEALRRASELRLPSKLVLSIILTGLGSVAFSLIVIGVTAALRIQMQSFWREFASEFVLWFSPIGVWTAAALAITYNAEIAVRERRLAALREEAHEAQIRALQYQLNPHFLYNTLNSISALILDGRAEAAEHMVLGLSNFLRETLNRDPLLDIALDREMELQRIYLDIEATRFEDGLDVEIDLPPALADAQVPGLILQPLVENAMKHGVPEPGSRMLLSVSARRAGEDLVVEVKDNGPGAGRRERGDGIGLRNIRERLALRYGDRAELEATSAADGFVARITMPLVLS